MATPGWRTVVILSTILFIVIGGAQFAEARAAITLVSTDRCELASMAVGALALESKIDTTAAVHNAERSTLLESLAVRLNPGGGFTYSTTFFLWDFGESCKQTLQSVNVVFTLFGSASPSLRLVVTETPADLTVDGISIEMNAARSAVAEWSGWYLYSSGEPGGSWKVPTLSMASQCISYGCDVDLWIGQTNEYGGTNGIAQTGTDSYVEEIPGCCTYFTQYAWYEFWPAGTQTCFNVNPGDSVSATTEYLGSDEYYTYLSDGTSGHSCSSTATMSMGSPTYANFIEEQQTDPSCGCLYGTPPFTQVLFNQLGIGSNDDLLDYSHYQFTNSADVTVGPLEFGGMGCVAEWSCFTLSYS
jgi:hypothetical protein